MTPLTSTSVAAAAAHAAQRAETANHALITSDRVQGTPVYNRDGEHIGHIDKLSINKVSGQVAYALMSFGGFLSIGERFHPIPWTALKYDVNVDGYVVPMSKEKLKAAPSFSNEELDAYGGGERRYNEELLAYYGMGPYW